MKKLKEGDEIQFKVNNQGAPIINSATVAAIGENIIAIHLDMKSKYCEFSYWSGDDECTEIYISASERSLNLYPKIKRNMDTGIVFSGLENYRVFGSSAGRYTINICLIKKNKNI